MNRFLVSGFFSPEKQDFVFRLAGLDALTPSSAKNFLIVVPNRRFGTLLERALLKSLNHPGLVLPSIKTIDDVWLSVIREKNPDLQFETRWQRMLLIRKVLSGSCAEMIRFDNPDGWLDYYHKSIQVYESVMDETGECPESLLENMGQDTGFIKQFETFYSAYRFLADQLNLVSRERLRFFLPSDTDYFSPFQSVLFLSLDEWIEDHWKFLVNNVDKPETVVFSVEVSDPTDTRQPFSVIHSSVFGGSWKLTRFEQPEPAKTKKLFRFDSIQEELEFIAGSIRSDLEMKREEQVVLHDICIVVKDRKRYLPWIQMLFHEYKIPFNLSAGFPVHQSSIVRFVSIILDLSTGISDYKNLRNFLLHPFISDNLTFRQIDEVYIQTGDHQYVNDWQLNLRKENNGKSNQAAPLAFERLESLKKQLSELNSCRNLSEWSQFLMSWVHSVLSANRATNRDILDFASWTAYQKVTQTFAELSSWKSGSLKLDKTDFRFLINLVLESMTWNEPVRNGVQILGPLEVKGYRFSKLYFTGLEQHVYPSTDKETMIFPVSLVKNIDQFYFMNLRYREWAEFETIMLNPTDELILSWSSNSTEDNQEPSPFVSLSGVLLSDDQPRVESLIPRKQFISSLKTVSGIPAFLNEKAHWFHHTDRLNGPGMFDGMITSDYAKAVWKGFLDDRNSTLSASAIDSFSQCGQRYFYERVLHIVEPEKFQEEVDPKDRGTWLHGILQEFIEQRNSNHSLSDWDLLVSLVDKNIPKEIDITRFLPSKLSEKLKNRAISPLSGFLETQTGLDLILAPALVEWSFGKENSTVPPLTIEIPNSRTFNFTGQIDRIDRHKNGLTVFYDYKSGDQAHVKKMAETGRSFQLLIYYEVVSRFKPLGSDVDWMSYFILTEPGNTPQSRLNPFFGTLEHMKILFPKARARKDFFKDHLAFLEFLDVSKENLLDQLRKLENGEFFHNKTAWMHSKKGFSCSEFCPFTGYCRKDEARIKNLHDQNGENDED